MRALVEFRSFCACLCLPACVCLLCGGWGGSGGGSGGTDGSWSALVWCSLAAKDQAKNCYRTRASFSPTLQTKITHLFLFYILWAIQMFINEQKMKCTDDLVLLPGNFLWLFALGN